MWNGAYDLQILKFFGLRCRQVKAIEARQIFWALPPYSIHNLLW